MSYIKKHKLHLFAFAVYIELFFYYFVKKLASVGSSDLGMPLAAADRFLNSGKHIYSSIEEGLLPSSSYFPANTFLAVIFRKLFGYNAETALILFGGITFIVAAYIFVNMINNTEVPKPVLGLCLALFMVSGFPSLKNYVLQIHPDVPVLSFFLIGFMLSLNFLEKELSLSSCIKIAASVIFMAISGIFKQNSVFLFMGYGLYLLFTKKYSIRKRIIALGAEFLSGVIVIVTIVSLDECWLSTITVNSKHAFMSITDYLLFGFITCSSNAVFVILLAIFAILFFTRNLSLENEYQKAWLAASTLWFLFNMYGALKEGANNGNMEAGLIAFMPFVLLLIKVVIVRLKSVINADALEEIAVSLKAKKVVAKTIILVFSAAIILTAAYSGYKIYDNFKNYKNRLTEQRIASEWINEKFGGKTIAIFSGDYELYKGTSKNAPKLQRASKSK